MVKQKPTTDEELW